MSSRVLLIGLDGASFTLLDALEVQGVAPRLSALRREGAWGILLSTVPPFTVPAWSSMMTGKGPGKHGVISFFEQSPTEYQCQDRGRFVNGLSVAGETLWQVLSRDGRRVVVINVPMTYPPRPVNGCLITGMLTPYAATDFTYPPDLAGRLGDYQIDLQYARRGNRIDPDAYPRGLRLIEELRAMTRRRGEVALQLMRECEWDLFVIVFTGTDRMCHFFWPEIVHPEKGNSRVVAAIKAYYWDLDHAVGRLLDQAGSQTNVLVMSDHGFGPAPSFRFYPNRWLEQAGWLHRRPASSNRGRWRDRLSRWLPRGRMLRRVVKKALPSRLQERVRRDLGEDLEATIDWASTRAYFVPLSNNVGGIEINRAGLKREGTVPPDQVGPLREQIIQTAMRLTLPGTEEPLVLRAQPREEVYSGPYVHTFPDVILTLRTDCAFSPSLRGRSIIERIQTPRRPGEHRREGIFIASGPAIRPGRLTEPAHIEDIMPTVLYLLDAALPDDLDGRVIHPAIEEAYRREHPVRLRAAASAERSVTSDLDEKDQAAIEDRLRALGYL